jgi:transposase
MVEVVLAAAALPSPPPLAALHRDPTDPALPALDDPGIQELLDLLPRADVYLQDEVQIALHPTLTRVWCRAGRRGQRLVQAPGTNRRKWGFGAVDWRDGWVDWAVADKRAAEPFCTQLRRLVARSQERGRVAVVLLDNLGIHTVRGSIKLRELLADVGSALRLVYTPSYDPDSNRIEWLWAIFRDAVTHNHHRQTLTDLLADAEQWVQALAPADVLHHLGSPGADLPVTRQEVKDAA